MKPKLPITLLFLCLLLGCTPEPIEIPHRESMIPDNVIKMTPDNDAHPPLSLSEEFEQPVPLPSSINSKGSEDSAFILPDGQTLYFWYTPDSQRDVVAQSTDLVTGIYSSHLEQGGWSEPERIWLIEPGKAVLDGCGFFTTTQMWFCTVREGFTGMHWFTANFVEGKWTNWQVDDFDPTYEVGEFHIYGDKLYYHADREGGVGGMDIWLLVRNIDNNWEQPVNLTAVNSERDEGWPAISPDGSELWISKDYGLWRSKLEDEEWTEPVLMFSSLAGEASIDADGNVYFTHHFYDESGEVMFETDIYVAYRK